ncbi:unnamed protein product [Closterium sp. Naga37s-1]|nr:unnamed protein product [Closterium sp. Naga37s-1]
MPSLPRRESHAAAVSSSAVFSPPPIVLPPHPFLPTLIPSLAEHKAHIIPRRGSNSIPLTSSSPLTYRRPRFPRFPVALTPKNNRFATSSLTPSPTCPHGHSRARLPPSSLTLPRSSPPLPPIVGQASPHRRPRFPPSSPTLSPIVAHASPHRRPRFPPSSPTQPEPSPTQPEPSPTLSPTVAHAFPHHRPPFLQPSPTPTFAHPHRRPRLPSHRPRLALPPTSLPSHLSPRRHHSLVYHVPPLHHRFPCVPSPLPRLVALAFPIATLSTPTIVHGYHPTLASLFPSLSFSLPLSLSPTLDGEVWRAGLGARDGVVTRSLWGVEGCVVSSTHPFLSCTDLLPSLAPTLHAWQSSSSPSPFLPSFRPAFLSSSLPPVLPSSLPSVLPSSRPPFLPSSLRPVLFPSIQSLAPPHPISSLPSNELAHSPPVTHARTLPSTDKSFSASVAYAFISSSLISPFLISPFLISPFLISPSLISPSLISPSFISPFRLTPFCPTPFRHAILLLIPIPSFPHPSFPDPIIPSANFPIPPYGHTPSRDLPVTSTRPLSSLLLPIFPSSASLKGLFFITSAIHPFYTHPLLPIHPIPKSCPYPSSRDPSSRFLIPSSPRPVPPCLPSAVPHLHLYLPSSILVTVFSRT